jgi:hypothetical protein
MRVRWALLKWLDAHSLILLLTVPGIPQACGLIIAGAHLWEIESKGFIFVCVRCALLRCY